MSVYRIVLPHHHILYRLCMIAWSQNFPLTPISDLPLLLYYRHSLDNSKKSSWDQISTFFCKKNINPLQTCHSPLCLFCGHRLLCCYPLPRLYPQSRTAHYRVPHKTQPSLSNSKTSNSVERSVLANVSGKVAPCVRAYRIGTYHITVWLTRSVLVFFFCSYKSLP